MHAYMSGIVHLTSEELQWLQWSAGLASYDIGMDQMILALSGVPGHQIKFGYVQEWIPGKFNYLKACMKGQLAPR